MISRQLGTPQIKGEDVENWEINGQERKHGLWAQSPHGGSGNGGGGGAMYENV